MEDLAHSSDLAQILCNKPLAENDVKFYVAQILLALKELHIQGVYHQDVSPYNVKITPNGYVKLSNLANRSPFIDFESPEVISGSNPSKACDFWSLGVLTFLMITGSHPYLPENKRGSLMRSDVWDILKDPKINFGTSISAKGKDFIKHLLDINPSKRLGVKSIQDVISHPWMSSFNWSGIFSMEMAPPRIPTRVKPKDTEFDDLFVMSGSFSGRSSITHLDSPMSDRRRGSNWDSSLSTERTSSSESISPRFSLTSLTTLDKSFSHSDVTTISSTPTISPLLGDPDRLQIVKELFNTEKTYVLTIQTLIQDFYNPLQKILSNEAHAQIFHSFPTIVAVNGHFLTELRKLLFNGTSGYVDLAKLLITETKPFKLYVEYISNYRNAISIIAEQKAKNKEFKTFLSKKYEELMKRDVPSDIASYMICPIQRLPRYKMLIEEIWKHTPVDERDEINAALEQIKQIVSYCNEKDREMGSLRKVFDLQVQFKLPHIAQTLVVEKRPEEIVRIMINQKRGLFIPDSLVIFQDLIVVVKGKDVTRIPLINMTITGDETVSPYTQVRLFNMMMPKGEFRSIIVQFECYDTWQRYRRCWYTNAMPENLATPGAREEFKNQSSQKVSE